MNCRGVPIGADRDPTANEIQCEISEPYTASEWGLDCALIHTRRSHDLREGEKGRMGGSVAETILQPR
jgi:hypothetical protein